LRGRRAVNRHGEVTRALNDARIPDKHDKAMRLLLLKARHADAVIPDDQWAPSVARLADRLHVSDRTAQRILADLQEHGWLTRRATDRRARIVGLLGIGRDFGYRTGGLCPVDEQPLPSPRARTCSARCRKAAQRDRNRDNPQASGRADAPEPTTRNVTRGDRNWDNAQVSGLEPEPATGATAESHPAGDMNCDGVTFHDAQGRHAGVTNPRPAAELTREPHRGEEGEDMPEDDHVECFHCHARGRGDLGLVRHSDDCWWGGLGGIAALYEAEP
jgi:hypothetical protein